MACLQSIPGYAPENWIYPMYMDNPISMEEEQTSIDTEETLLDLELQHFLKVLSVRGRASIQYKKIMLSWVAIVAELPTATMNN